MNEIAVATQTLDLIPVFSGVIGDTPQQVCSARDLHSFLESGRHFTDWFSSRVTKYGFVDNQDFASFSQKSEKLPEGRPATDFQLTLGMAKELGMVENNERGRQVRRYFIEVEKRQHSAALAPMTPVQIGAQVITEMMRVAELLEVPKSFAVQVATEAAVRQSGMTEWARLTTQAACMTNVPQEDVMLEPTELGKYFDLNPAKMNRWLADHGLQVRVADQWQPTEQGSQLCVRHAWSSGFKSGYTLKWRYTAIKHLMGADKD